MPRQTAESGLSHVFVHTAIAEVTPERASRNLRHNTTLERIVLIGDLPPWPNMIRITAPLRQVLEPYTSKNDSGPIRTQSFILIPPHDISGGSWQIHRSPKATIPDSHPFFRVETVNDVGNLSGKLQEYRRNITGYERGTFILTEFGNWLLLRDGELNTAYPNFAHCFRIVRSRTQISDMARSFEPALWIYSRRAHLALYKITSLNSNSPFLLRARKHPSHTLFSS